MSKLKALLLTQGMHGMISQVEGLAKALNLDYKHQTIKLKTFCKNEKIGKFRGFWEILKILKIFHFSRSKIGLFPLT